MPDSDRPRLVVSPGQIFLYLANPGHLDTRVLQPGLSDNASMARKRRNSSSSESEDLPEAKRTRPFAIAESDLDFEPTTHEEPRVNPTYGQKGAFPGLGDTSEGDELFYGPASNGLEYLRMVR